MAPRLNLFPAAVEELPRPGHGDRRMADVDRQLDRARHGDHSVGGLLHVGARVRAYVVPPHAPESLGHGSACRATMEPSSKDRPHTNPPVRYRASDSRPGLDTASGPGSRTALDSRLREWNPPAPKEGRGTSSAPVTDPGLPPGLRSAGTAAPLAHPGPALERLHPTHRPRSPSHATP